MLNIKSCLAVSLILFVVCFTSSNSAKQNIIDIYRKEVFDYAVLLNQKPVVVLYTAQSCSVCNGVQNRLEEFARENSDKLYLAIADFDKKPQLKETFGIEKLPTTRTFYKGQMMDEFKGPVWPSIRYISSKLLKIK